MSWSWTYENTDGTVLGRSETFGSRGDAETWIGENFGNLLDDEIDQVRLYEDDTEVFGPMSLHPDD